MTDAQLYQTVDGGEIRYVNGQLVTDDGLATSFYLSMFGGNIDDDATEATEAEQWWGNLIEGEPTRRYRSRTQHIIQSLPLTTGNLRTLEDAVMYDLAWTKETGLVSDLAARASIPARNTVRIDVNAEVDGKVIPFQFVKPWGV